mmetsp:Transcript_31110/g.95193  ORF Transcript_31110/g.95193 Transcript_31110/m.95193 type:complete len:210 (+) Transcript_31110:1254-1883(+)|eukprot:scaffold15548_cov31-Tisochrysis_lutea.AAC.3
MSACGDPASSRRCAPSPSTMSAKASCSAAVCPVAHETRSAPSFWKAERRASWSRGESSRAKQTGRRPQAVSTACFCCRSCMSSIRRWASRARLSFLARAPWLSAAQEGEPAATVAEGLQPMSGVWRPPTVEGRSEKDEPAEWTEEDSEHDVVRERRRGVPGGRSAASVLGRPGGEGNSAQAGCNARSVSTRAARTVWKTVCARPDAVST